MNSETNFNEFYQDDNMTPTKIFNDECLKWIQLKKMKKSNQFKYPEKNMKFQTTLNSKSNQLNNDI